MRRLDLLYDGVIIACWSKKVRTGTGRLGRVGYRALGV